MATIYDVAALAEVSPATVSRVFNGTAVSADKVERVRDAAALLAYTPNRTARTLRKQSSEIIALVIPDIENPFFTALARGVEDRARADGYSLVLCNTDDDATREAHYLEIAALEHMAGVIIAPASSTSDLGPLHRRGTAVVAVDRTINGIDVDTVVFDNHGAGATATEALIERGFTRIACITGPLGVWTADQRADGWRDALVRNGITPDESLLVRADFRVDGGRRATDELLDLEAPPEAVFVANNLMAVGAVDALRERSMCPTQLGIAVFGDLPFTSAAPAGVSVVSVAARELGELAVDLLIERMRGNTSPPRIRVVEAVLSPSWSNGATVL
jgi:LacI family transcriptional regulator